jgi:hypothetical protein
VRGFADRFTQRFEGAVVVGDIGVGCARAVDVEDFFGLLAGEVEALKLRKARHFILVGAVDPSGAAIEGNTEGRDVGEDAATYARACLEHHHRSAAGDEHARRLESGDAGADDHDIGILRRRRVNRASNRGSEAQSQNATTGKRMTHETGLGLIPAAA